MWERRGRRVERALEVDVDHRFQLLRVELQERAICPYARVRDSHIEAAEALDHRVGGLIDLGPVPHVAGQAESPFETQIVAAPREQPDRRACVMQPPRNRRTNASARARD
jgi:hypothetical protein